MGAEQPAYRSLNETLVKVATETFWKAASINDIHPEGIGNRCPFQIAQAIGKRGFSTKASQKEAIFKAPRADAIAVPNVRANRVIDTEYLGDRVTATSTLDISGVTRGERYLFRLRDDQDGTQVR